MTDWFPVSDKPGWEVGVESDCSGAAECIALHIRQTVHPFEWREAHLNYAEARRVRKLIRKGIRARERSGWADGCKAARKRAGSKTCFDPRCARCHP